MDSDSGSDQEVERILHVRKKNGPEAPPSSYGSMKSDEEEDEIIAEAGTSLAKPEIPGTTYGATLLQLNRSESPETLYTEITQQQSTRHGAYFTDGKLEGGLDEMDEAEQQGEDEEDWQDSPPQADSPEPPVVEPEGPVWSEQPPSEDAELGQLHPELDIPFIFRSIQNTLSTLTNAELYQYKRNLCGRDAPFTIEQLLDMDSLDLVDKILEAHGKGSGLRAAINAFSYIKKPLLAEELETTCKRAVVQYDLRRLLIRKHNTIHEGVPRAGQQLSLHIVHVEPNISTRGRGGVLPYHPVRDNPPSPPPIASPDTYIAGKGIFRPTPGSSAVLRTVLTTGIAGIGFTVGVQKFIMDWSKDKANRDIQFIFKISFRELWSKREYHLETEGKRYLTFMQMLNYYYDETKNITFLTKPDCRALFILEAIDRYQSTLDFKNTPTVTDVHQSVDLDVLIVNLIRGTLLPNCLVWVTGRRAATAQIPAELIHRVCEIQGFGDAQKDEFLMKRYTDKDFAEQLLDHVKALPPLYALCYMPQMCWMVAMVFERCFRSEHYAERVAVPKLTPFYVHFLIVQTNRKLERYFGADHNDSNWSDEERDWLLRLGKMALKLLEKNRSVFYEEDIKEYSLGVTEVASYSGLCTELPLEDSPDRRRFCFVHYTFQEFMAALYVFLLFRLEGRTVLDKMPPMPRLFKERAMVDLLRGAIDRTLGAPFGQYDMFLRFVCGLALRANNNHLLRGLLFDHNSVLLKGLDEGAKLLQKKKETTAPERHHNLDECIRELTQKDE